MASPVETVYWQLRYKKAERAAFAELTLEQIMEAPPSATQRKITLASFDEITGERRDVHLYNELLVLYNLPNEDVVRRVVPDNMVVLADQAPQIDGSYSILFQPVKPLLMFEYVSQQHIRKDYEDNRVRYEQLKIPYYLLFNHDAQEMILFRLKGKRYVTVKPNANDRYEIPELEMEIAIVEGWVRYWFRGELLELPSVLRKELQDARKELTRTRRQATTATRRAEQAEAQAEQSRLDAERERQARLAVEAELAALRRQMGQSPPPS